MRRCETETGSPNLADQKELEVVGRHEYEDITLGPDACWADGRATVVCTEAKLLILHAISGG